MAIGHPNVRLDVWMRSMFSLTDIVCALSAGKLKFKFKGKDEWTAPFLALLQGRTTEIILRDPVQLQYVADAAEAASVLPGADLEQLEQLRKIIDKKKSTIGTKAQLKPSFSDDVCETLAIVVKWGGEVRVGPCPGTALRGIDDPIAASSSRTRRGTRRATLPRICGRASPTRSLRMQRHRA